MLLWFLLWFCILARATDRARFSAFGFYFLISLPLCVFTHSHLLLFVSRKSILHLFLFRLNTVQFIL